MKRAVNKGAFMRRAVSMGYSLAAMLAVATGIGHGSGGSARPSPGAWRAAQVWRAPGPAWDATAHRRETWVAGAGGLLRFKAAGPAVVELPELAAWRGVAAGPGGIGAVALDTVAWRTEGGAWQQAPLESGEEGLSIAAVARGWWVGTSRGARRLDAAKGSLSAPLPGFIEPVRRLAGGGAQTWALGERKFRRLPTGALISPPALSAGPWCAAVHSGVLRLSGAGSEDPLAVWEWDSHGAAGGSWRRLPRLPANGSHITALSDGDRSLVAAVAGDGWWELRGGRWRRLAGLPPELAHDTVALARQERGRRGVSRAGALWEHGSSRWQRRTGAECLPAGNIQALETFEGRIYASTFDAGVLVLERGQWRPVAAGGPERPRQMAVSGGRLYVREADGRLSAFDGEQWERHLLRNRVPRDWIGSLVADRTGLVLGGWGGLILGSAGDWRWRPLPPPWSQQGINCLSLASGAVICGTGKLGAFAVGHGSGVARNLPGGPADPWITALLPRGDEVVVGTAAGQVGLTGRSHPGATLGAPVTALAELPPVGTIAATRAGLFRADGSDWEPWAAGREGVPSGFEPQCLLRVDSELWVGGRGGILRLSAR